MEKKDVNKKLDEFIDKYGINCDESLLDFMIRMNSSDMIFKQHLHSSKTLDIVIISIQLLFVILSAVLKIINFPIDISIFALVYNLIAFILVVINNYVSNHYWNKAQEDLSEIFKMLDVYKVRCKLQNWRCRIQLYFNADPLVCSCGHTFHFDYLVQKSYNSS